MKTKTDLKTVFRGLSSLYLVKGGISSLDSVAPDYDIPVLVDSLSMTNEAPTLNEEKIHGMVANWSVAAQAGAFNFSAKVPSVDPELVGYFMGGSSEIANAKINGKSYDGVGVKLKSEKLNVGICLVSEDELHMVVVKNLALYATPTFENVSTESMGFTLTGSIEMSDSDEDDILYLQRNSKISLSGGSGLSGNVINMGLTGEGGSVSYTVETNEDEVEVEVIVTKGQKNWLQAQLSNGNKTLSLEATPGTVNEDQTARLILRAGVATAEYEVKTTASA